MQRTLTDRFVDFLFSKDERKWLILIVILGVILRLIVASHLTPVEDEMGHGVHAIGVSKLAPLSTIAQAQVWYYLTDYVYRFFGIFLFTSRFLSIIFGTLSIIMVYLITSEISNKKAGLIAAFILAISAYHITWTAVYQDQTMMFFVLCASYFFIKTYKETKKISILSALFLGIAVLVKLITGVFIVVFGFFMLSIIVSNYLRDKKMFKKNLIRAVLFIGIIAVAMLPIVSYNYFLYKDKGIVDLPLAQFLRINADFYTGPGLHHEEGFVISKLPKNLYTVLTLYFLKEDLIISILGFLGIIYTATRLKYKENRFELSFLLVMFFFVLIFIASSIVLQTHYTSFFPLFSIFGASFILFVTERKKLSMHSKKIILILLLTMLLINVWNIREPLTSKSAIEKMREFAVENVDDNTLVLVDSRIYVGTTAWVFNDKNYIDASYISNILEASSNKQTNYLVKTVFIECVNDDCGWGTVKDNPGLNQSMEELVSYFKNVSKTTDILGGGSITGVRGADVKDVPFYRVHETKLLLNPAVLEATKQTHNHFFYHIPRNEYPEQAFDYYTVNGFFDKTLNLISYTVLYLILIMAVLSLAIPFYLIIKNDVHRG